MRQAVLVWARRGAKTYTVFVEHIIPRMVEESMNVVIVYPTSKQGFKNFWTNIENDGFKTLDHIPKELIAAQSNSEDDMRITLVNGSTLFVMGATKAEALRGANAKIYFFDEFVDIPSGALGVVRPITNMNGGQIIITSTPKQDGISGGTFKRLYESALKRDDQYASFIPGDRFMTQEQMDVLYQDYMDEYESDFLYKQEVLLDWGQSSLTSYFGDALSKMEKDGRISDAPYDARKPVYTSWDLGSGAGTTAILFWQYSNKELFIIDQYETHDIGDEAIARFVLGKPYNYAWHFWPHDGAKADSDIISRIAKIREYGLINTSLLVRKGKEAGINRTINLLNKSTTKIYSPTCVSVIDKWKKYQRKFNEFTGDYEGPEHKTESHCLSGDTLVWTVNGKKPIKDLVGSTGQVITDGGHIRKYKDVRKTNTVNEWLEVELANGDTIKCTTDHMLRINNDDFVPARWLLLNDVIHLDTHGTYRIHNKEWPENKGYKVAGQDMETLPRRALLQLQLLYTQVAQGGLGTLQRANTRWSRSRPHRLGYRQQRYIKPQNSYSSTKQEASFTRNDREVTIQPKGVRSTESNRVAQEQRGQSLALRTRKIYSQLERADRKDLFTLWKDFYYERLKGINKILPPELQDESSQTKITRITRRCGTLDVYNMEVDGKHSYLINSGVASHNCADALRYAAEAIDQSFNPTTGEPYMTSKAQKTTIDENENWNMAPNYGW